MTARSRSLRCLWTLEELGLTGYKLITMPFPPRLQHRSYLKVNPLGTVPFFTDNDGVAMTESCAIPVYLCAKFAPTPLAVDPEESDFSAYINWLAHADATLTFPQTVVLRYQLQEPGRADCAAEDYGRWFLARLRMLDSTLADGRTFLCSGRFTIADICITYALYLGTTLRLDDEPIATRYKPQTLAYMERMMARDAWCRAQLIQQTSADAFEQEHTTRAKL